MSDREAGDAGQGGVPGGSRPNRGPEPGDVLISRIDGTPPIYALRVIPSVYQIVFNMYDDAQDHAERFAQWQRVDVWTVDPSTGSNGQRFAPAARYRLPPPPSR